MSVNDSVKKTIDIPTGFAIGGCIQAIGTGNAAAASIFALAIAYSLYKTYRGEPKNYTPYIMVGAALLLTGIELSNALDPQTTERAKHLVVFVAAAFGLAGDAAIAIETNLKKKLTSFFNSNAGVIKKSAVAVAINPSFWFSLCGIGFSSLGLVSAPGVLTAAALGAGIGMSCVSVGLSTKRFLDSLSGKITSEEINDGHACLWAGRANVFSTLSTSLGAVIGQNPELLLVGIANIVFMLTYKRIAELQAADVAKHNRVETPAMEIVPVNTIAARLGLKRS